MKAGNAVLAADMFTFGGPLAKGRKMTNDLGKLMLRAYNAEADNCVRSLRSGNIATATKRLDPAVQAIEKLGAIMEMRVNPDYHALRVPELELTADYQMKVQEEREQAREERELLREQKRAEQELAAERERLDKERTHYVTVLESLRASGDNTAADELATRLGQIEQAIEANDYRIANIRAGYVYVISNVGTFGPNVVKIGMTRRLEPRDRIRELGDASVPFLSDVHALFFSDRRDLTGKPAAQNVRGPAGQPRQPASRVLLRNAGGSARRARRKGRRTARVQRHPRSAGVLPVPGILAGARLRPATADVSTGRVGQRGQLRRRGHG